VRLALAQVNATVGTSRERPKVLSAATAPGGGAGLVAFPEMVLPRYRRRPAAAASFVEENLEAWREVAGKRPGVAVVGFVGPDGKGRVYNAGRRRGGRAGAGRLSEDAHFPTTASRRDALLPPGTEPGIFPVGGARVGSHLRGHLVRRGPWRREARGGANLILNISASPVHAGSGRASGPRGGARAADRPSGATATCGGQDELVFDAGSMWSAPRAK